MTQHDDLEAQRLEVIERSRHEPISGKVSAAPLLSGDVSQVYSLRIPVKRIAQLRRIADEQGVAPSALMRTWVLERLDKELQGDQAEKLSVLRRGRKISDIDAVYERQALILRRAKLQSSRVKEYSVMRNIKRARAEREAAKAKGDVKMRKQITT